MLESGSVGGRGRTLTPGARRGLAASARQVQSLPRPLRCLRCTAAANAGTPTTVACGSCSLVESECYSPDSLGHATPAAESPLASGGRASFSKAR